MPYDEFLRRLERIGLSPVLLAEKAGFADPRRSRDGWRRTGVPKTLIALLKAYETIEFQAAAILEFNRRIAELKMHSRELVE